MKTQNWKEWLRSMRLSVTIPAGLLVHIAAKISGEKTNWLLVIEIFFIASLAMIHNDYYDRVNDCKKDKTFAFNHPKEFEKIIFIGWSIVGVLALTFLLQYWMTLIPVIIISAFYSYTRKIMHVQTLCVAVTSASPFLIGHIDKTNELNNINFVLFWVVFICIYAREMAKNIEDAKTDVGYKITPVTTTHPILKNSLDTYLQGAAALMLLVFMVFGLTVIKANEHSPISLQIYLMLIIISGIIAGTLWSAKGSIPGLMIIERIEDRTDEEVFENLKWGKNIFDFGMICGIIGALILL